MSMDHVPPKQFFPKQLRSEKSMNLWVAPTHRECNEKYREDEEYFYHAMYALVRRVNPRMGQTLLRDFQRRSSKSQTPAMLRRVLATMTTVTDGGIHLPPGTVRVNVDEYRVQQTVLKIARGLFYLDYLQFMPLENGKDIRCCEHEEDVPELYKLTPQAVPAKTICPEVFSYRHFEFQGLHLWSLLFWESFLFCTAFDSPRKTCSTVQSRKGTVRTWPNSVVDGRGRTRGESAVDKNTAHLAGEFLVAGELARRQLSVALTFGNAKSVDICAESENHMYRVDAKAVRAKSNWPISTAQVKDDVVYVFVYLGSHRAIHENKPPEFFIVKGADLLSKSLISSWGGGRSGVTCKALKGSVHENAWAVFE